MAFFSGSFGGLSGLAKEVSLDDFHKGLQMGELREAKKVAAKAKQDEYKQRMLEQIKPLDTKLLPILRSEYDAEQEKIFADIAEDTRTGKIFEDGRLVGDYKRKLLENKNKSEAVSQALESFIKTDPKYLTPAALDWKQQLERVDKPYTDVKKEFAAKYSGEDFITPEGDVDLSKLIVTDQNPIGTLSNVVKDQHYSTFSQEVPTANGGTMTRNYTGPIRTIEQKNQLIEQGLVPPDAVSYEDVLNNNLNNEEFVTNVKRNHNKEFKTYSQQILENWAKGAALAAGQKEGTTLYKDEYNRIKNDPQVLQEVEKEAVKKLGMDLAVLPNALQIATHNPKSTKGSGSGRSSKTPKAGYYQMMQQNYNNMQSADDATWNAKVFKSNKNVLNAYAEANGFPSKGDWSKAAPEQVVVFDIPIDDTKRMKTSNMTTAAGSFQIARDHKIPMNTKNIGENYKKAQEAEQWLRANYPSVPIVLAKENVQLFKKDGKPLIKKEVDEMPRLLKSATPKVNRLYKVDFSKIPKDKLYDKSGRPSMLHRKLKEINQFYLNLPFDFNGDVSSYDTETDTKKSYQTDQQEEFEQ